MLENVDRIMSRMQQIERKMEGNPVQSSDFQQLMNERLGQPEKAAKAGQMGQNKLDAMANINRLTAMQNLNPLGGSCSNASAVVPLAQNNSVSCGQTSVAMCINALTGKNYQDYDINNKYGFELLNALKAETQSAGYSWHDGGEVSASSWNLIDHKVNVEKLPVIVALNGPEFSPSGRGHIVTIIKTEGDNVTYADPATGTLKTTTKQAMNMAPQHPDGNFIFYSNQENQALPTNILPFS
ncbi:MAG: hypothetical protein AB7S38_21300 [Vulcanimicrobiota bacterium]